MKRNHSVIADAAIVKYVDRDTGNIRNHFISLRYPHVLSNVMWDEKQVRGKIKEIIAVFTIRFRTQQSYNEYFRKSVGYQYKRIS